MAKRRITDKAQHVTGGFNLGKSLRKGFKKAGKGLRRAAKKTGKKIKKEGPGAAADFTKGAAEGFSDN